jgi:hypothetical protein|tara:strand:- start:1443 stop:2057 length:615 start_codon:yes stop_codon:yes gene_type:complete
MSQGDRFLQKCLETQVQTDPWPYQLIENTFDNDVFEKLKQQCIERFSEKTDKLIQVFPSKFKENGIDFYDETVDVCEKLHKNLKQVHEVYPQYRKYPTMGINVHLSITPPLPYKFYIHQEGLEKTWSSVTYVAPEKNIGTKMYTAQNENTFVREAEWKPNSTFIFCGQQNKTWHSYESNQDTNRITFNMFIMKRREGKCFYPFQ